MDDLRKNARDAFFHSRIHAVRLHGYSFNYGKDVDD